MVPGKSNEITMGYLEDHSWPFNLWADILNSPQCAQTAEKDTEQTAAVLYWPNLDNVLAAALDDRQQKVIRMRYERGMTLAMIGDALGCSQERVRQIILRSLRRLREPQYFQRLTAIPESEVLQLRVKVHELVRQQEDLKKQIISIFGETGAKEVARRSQLPLDSPVDALGISIRSRNRLIAGGIDTIADLIRCKESTLRGFRNMGKLSISEIKSSLEQNGYHLMPEKE